MTTRNVRSLLILFGFVGIIFVVAIYWWVISAWPGHTAAEQQLAEHRASMQHNLVDPERARRAVASDSVIVMQIDRYFAEVGRYPTALSEVVGASAPPPADSVWRGPYLTNPDLAKDPWGRPFQYRSPGAHNTESYDLWSAGADGVNGTADDIGNW